MSAITIRNLPETVHDGLRQMAAANNLSVEALVRNLLATSTEGATVTKATGMSEATAPWGATLSSAQSTTELWGALHGTIHIPASTDLTAPADTWEAAR
jgi:plasmid stability protein